MAPGMPTITPDGPSPPAATSPPKPLSPDPLPNAVAASLSLPSSSTPSPSTLNSLLETWEEVRDAVVETDLARALSLHLRSASRTADRAWAISKTTAWILATSALVLVVPLLYEIDKELGPAFDPAVSTSTSPAANPASETPSNPASDPAGGHSTSPNTS